MIADAAIGVDNPALGRFRWRPEVTLAHGTEAARCHLSRGGRLMLFHDDLADFIAHPDGANLHKWETANIPEVGVIRDVLGPNDDQDMASNPGGHSVTQQVDRLPVDCDGIAGDRHRGLTRPSTGREAPLYKEVGTLPS